MLELEVTDWEVPPILTSYEIFNHEEVPEEFNYTPEKPDKKKE